MALALCQSCHIITVTVTQDRTREAWLGTMNSPSHIEIETTPSERGLLADYLVINAGIPSTRSRPRCAPAAPPTEGRADRLGRKAMLFTSLEFLLLLPLASSFSGGCQRILAAALAAAGEPRVLRQLRRANLGYLGRRRG